MKNKSYKKIISNILVIIITLLSCVLLSSCGNDIDDNAVVVPTASHKIELTYHGGTIDGKTIKQYDYTWHADIYNEHNEVENSAAEYFTGTKPTGEEDVYIAHDTVYFPQVDTNLFSKVRYDGREEWAVNYQIDKYKNYIFGTLPIVDDNIPTQMMHSEKEGYDNPRLHIGKPGVYEITGDWHGQIFVDLGFEAINDDKAVVTLILNDIKVTCDVAPALVFDSVYECDNKWNSKKVYTEKINTKKAGANIYIKENTYNYFVGTNVSRLLKNEYTNNKLNEQVANYKLDGAINSNMSINISGDNEEDSILRVDSSYSSISTALHLTMMGGNVKLFSDNDGICCEQQNVSIATINGGKLHIQAGLKYDGAGIDSKGFLAMNGGEVISIGNSNLAPGLYVNKGIYVYKGILIALGEKSNWPKIENVEKSEQKVLQYSFPIMIEPYQYIIIRDKDEQEVFRFKQYDYEDLQLRARSYQGAIFSMNELKKQEEYSIIYE